MRKEEFMRELEYLLQDIPDEEKADALAYYQDYLEEAGPENEQQAIADLGSPDEAAKALIVDLAAQNIKEKPKTMKGGLSALWIAVLAVCSAPVTLPIAICLLAVIAVVLFCVGIALFCVVISAVAVAASGILTLFGGIVLLFRSLGDGLCNIGLGLFSTGLGILFVYGAILLFKWLIRKASVSLGKITKGGRRNEKNNCRSN